MKPRIFISHASDDLRVAQEVESALMAADYDPWLDKSDIQLGGLLRKELSTAIKGSRAVVLLWSQAAASSRWVASEILRAFHTGRFIIPCVLDGTELPQFLSQAVHLDLRKQRSDALERLTEGIGKAPNSRNEFTAIRSHRDEDLRNAIQVIHSLQSQAMEHLGKRDFEAAQASYDELDPLMHGAERHWCYDSTILNLAGYHRKNGYMIKHWKAYCAGRFPDDPLLHEGERFFFDTLFVTPTDPSALNGLGNVLLFEGELDAAEFFVQHAIDCAREQEIDYPDAEHDLRVIKGRRAEA